MERKDFMTSLVWTLISYATDIAIFPYLDNEMTLALIYLTIWMKGIGLKSDTVVKSLSRISVIYLTFSEAALLFRLLSNVFSRYHESRLSRLWLRDSELSGFWNS